MLIIFLSFFLLASVLPSDGHSEALAPLTSPAFVSADETLGAPALLPSPVFVSSGLTPTLFLCPAFVIIFLGLFCFTE